MSTSRQRISVKVSTERLTRTFRLVVLMLRPLDDPPLEEIERHAREAKLKSQIERSRRRRQRHRDHLDMLVFFASLILIVFIVWEATG